MVRVAISAEELQAMASKSVQTEMCLHLGRMITNKLYECLEETADCPYKVMFGNGYFCTCRLNGRSERVDYKPARYKEYE
jgi:hypothetical protein